MTRSFPLTLSTPRSCFASTTRSRTRPRSSPTFAPSMKSGGLFGVIDHPGNGADHGINADIVIAEVQRSGFRLVKPVRLHQRRPERLLPRLRKTLSGITSRNFPIASAYRIQCVLGVLALGLCLLASSLLAETPGRHLTDAQWREDMQFMHRTMVADHKNVYHSVTPQQLDQAFAALDHAYLPTLLRHADHRSPHGPSAPS